MEQYKMLLFATDKGDYYRNSFTKIPLKWVSEERDNEGKPLRERIPGEEKKNFTRQTGFAAGGMTYRGPNELCHIRFQDSNLCQDIYGRQVLHLTERFPCFDSYDYLNENRYYHWFFIRQEEKLTMVYCEDTYPQIEVTEDIAQIRNEKWQELKKCWGFCRENTGSN